MELVEKEKAKRMEQTAELYDLDQDYLDKIENNSLIRVRDVQSFHFFDFEFMEKPQSPARSLLLSVYNKTNIPTEFNPMLQF